MQIFYLKSNFWVTYWEDGLRVRFENISSTVKSTFMNIYI